MNSAILRRGVLVVLLLGAGVPAAAEETPSGLVRRLNEKLIEVMRRAGELGHEGRYRVLAPVLSKTFHFSLMARISAGRHWRKLSAGQRERFIDVFSRMSITTFAARFNGYSGERFVVLGEEGAPRGAVRVKNQLRKSTGEVVPIHYLARKFRGGWRIVDVYLKALYSELALKRSVYGSVIKRKGFEAFIEALEGQIAKLQASPDS